MIRWSTPCPCCGQRIKIVAGCEPLHQPVTADKLQQKIVRECPREGCGASIEALVTVSLEVTGYKKEDM